MSPQESEPTAVEVLDEFLQAQARVAFETIWMAFAIGQAGAAFQLSPDREATKELLDQMGENILDLEASCRNFVGVCRGLHANAIASFEAQSE